MIMRFQESFSEDRFKCVGDKTLSKLMSNVDETELMTRSGEMRRASVFIKMLIRRMKLIDKLDITEKNNTSNHRTRFAVRKSSYDS